MATMAVAGSGSLAGVVSDQLRVQQAQRSADQAEVAARALRRQAEVAQREADVAQEGARTLRVRSDRAQTDAGQARQAVASLESVQTLREGFESLRADIASGLEAISSPTPTVNAEGQTTGTIVNVVA